MDGLPGATGVNSQGRVCPGPHMLLGQAGREEEGRGQTCKGLWVLERQLLNVGREEPALHSGSVAETDFLQLTK